jgi:dTDP-glucose pyrophosphorylase
MKEQENQRCILHNAVLIDALKQMDQYNFKLLIVKNQDRFEGLISIGDIQRAIINNSSLDEPINKILRKNIRVASPMDSYDDIKKMMLEYRMELCPVVDESKNITQVYYWEDLFPEDKPKVHATFNLPVVLMAGGFGARMRPLTYVLPKPLIPIGEKTILQEIFDRFHHYGCNQFYTSVNYKAEFIKDFVSKLNLPYYVSYFQEDKPLGTAGSLQLLNEDITTTFFVHNCDILIDNDYAEILEYHRTSGNEITVVAALKHFSMAYGTLETGENGELLSLSEKPEMTFKINSGLYVLEPHLLNEIPKDAFFHITDLIELVKTRKGKVGVFPVSEKSWTDIGNWEEYLKLIQSYNLNKTGVWIS